MPKRRSSLDRLARDAAKWRALLDKAREIEWRENRGLPAEDVEPEQFETRTLLARELAKGPDESWSDDAGEIGEVRRLATVRDVFDEGFAMKHCLASQASKALSGGSVYYRGRTASGDRATIELRVAENGGWFVHQVRGPCNQSPTADVGKLVRTWAAVRGMDVQDLVFGDLTELPDEPEEVPF